MGASEFAISVIKNGYVPQLIENPPRYEEAQTCPTRRRESGPMRQ